MYMLYHFKFWTLGIQISKYKNNPNIADSIKFANATASIQPLATVKGLCVSILI